MQSAPGARKVLSLSLAGRCWPLGWACCQPGPRPVVELRLDHAHVSALNEQSAGEDSAPDGTPGTQLASCFKQKILFIGYCFCF